MIVGFFKVLAGLWSWLGRLLAGIGEWLRKPHQWWQIGFFTVGCMFALATFYAIDQHKAVIVITNARAADAATYAITLSERDALLIGYKDQEARFARISREETAKLEAARAESADALAEVARLKLAADKNDAAWWSGYAKRSDVCKAAQESLDVACKSLGAY